MITAITPTGDRTESFELCRKWMASQTRQVDQWIVVDDGFEPLPKSLQKGIEYVRRIPEEGEGHTLTKNLEVALPLIKGDKILIIEDDDWYGPTYVKTMDDLLSKHPLVGEMLARYYFVPTMKCRRIANTKHASLCQTGFRKELLPLFKKCLDGNPYVDSRFWGAYGKGHLIDDKNDELHLHCSTKGMKGRKGIGTGHNDESRYYQPDLGLQNLVKWVGLENAKIYMKHVGQSFESALLIGKERRRNGRLLKRKQPPTTGSVAPPKRVPIKINKEAITVITLTGDRPECFDLLQKWMNNQTAQPNQWIVVDDGKEPIRLCKEFEYIRREPTPQDFTHTLCQNLPLALNKVRNDKIIIMEDDDWYSSIYIEYMDNLLKDMDLVGFGNLMFYYPFIGSYMIKDAAKRPAFAQTAFRKTIIPVLLEICAGASKEYDLCGKGLVDAALWNSPLNVFKKEKKVRLTSSLKIASGRIISSGAVFSNPIPNGILRRAQRGQGAEIIYEKVSTVTRKSTVRCDEFIAIGMKGMPGRKGLTSHHNKDNKKYKKDEGYKLLKSIIKKDVEFYLEFFP